METYERLKSGLVEKSEGKFALIKGEVLIGTFSDQEDALKVGLLQCGDEEFLIRQILRVEPSVRFFHGVA
jgi:hypothetical protein